MESKAIVLDNVTRCFSRRNVDASKPLKNFLRASRNEVVKAVDSVSFSIEPGETAAFLGPNGSGKSTTIKIMTGILFPDSGKVEVLGLSPQNDRVKLTKKIGCVFGQKSNLWFHLPAQDSFRLLGKIYGLESSRWSERTDELVKAFGLEKVLAVPVREMSLGQRMKCEIVASLLHRPEIVFLDEPTIGLDVVSKQQIRTELIRLNKEEGITIFLTSHDAGDVDQITKRAMVINNGRLLYDGSTAILKDHYIHTQRIEIVNEPSMESIIGEIYADLRKGNKVGPE